MLQFKTDLFVTRRKIEDNSAKNKKLKIITWNDEFELPDGCYSLSDIQDYIKYITKKHEALKSIPPVQIYVNRINNILVFKIYKPTLQTPDTMKLFDSP